MIFVSYYNGEIHGTDIELINNSPVYYELSPLALKDLEHFPNIKDLITKGLILQLYTQGARTYAEIGKDSWTGAYAENEFLEVYYGATSEAGNNYLALLNLENLIKERGQEEIEVIKRVYRPYGKINFN